MQDSYAEAAETPPPETLLEDEPIEEQESQFPGELPAYAAALQSASTQRTHRDTNKSMHNPGNVLFFEYFEGFVFPSFSLVSSMFIFCKCFCLCRFLFPDPCL